MNAKPHYRLRRLMDCRIGTRFYTRTTYKPYTVIASSQSRSKVWVRQDYGFIQTTRTWVGAAMGWVAV